MMTGRNSGRYFPMSLSGSSPGGGPPISTLAGHLSSANRNWNAAQVWIVGGPRLIGIDTRQDFDEVHTTFSMHTFDGKEPMTKLPIPQVLVLQ